MVDNMSPNMDITADFVGGSIWFECFRVGQFELW
jgi:hypothetical protein